MGYYSDIVIAIKKEVLIRNLIKTEIPEWLGQPTSTTEDAAYYLISGWKWYDSYPEIQKLKAWFGSMADEEFGVIRIGEDNDDTQEWGQPYDFKIYINRSLTYPGGK